jgi:hypothetical protein
MPCNQNCNQGRNCDCLKKEDLKLARAAVVITTLLFIFIFSIGFGLAKHFHGNVGKDCAVEVEFGGGVKATYLGTSV